MPIQPSSNLLLHSSATQRILSHAPSKHKRAPVMAVLLSNFTLAIVYAVGAYLLLSIISSKPYVTATYPDLPDLKLPKLDTPGGSGSNGAPDPCDSCRVLVKSFEKGMDKTNRGKHEGGDTSWEERNLKSYADSEIRLVEIQEDLCDEVAAGDGKAQCLSMAEDAEQHIEEWWFKERNKNVRLHDYLCISKLKKCCPENQFGPTCQKCTNCQGHGTCDGSGTRSGSGECICHPGYLGQQCGECADDHYRTRTGGAPDDGFECLQCHQACRGGCLGPTSANCTECKPGYARDPQTKLCIDINECEASQTGDLQLDSSKLCSDGTYCVNTDGHYRCADCHWACETCLGYGPDKCLACATDYEMDERHECQHFSVEAKSGSNLSYWSLILMLIAPTYGLYTLGRRLASAFCRVVGIDEVQSVYTQVVLKMFVSLIVTGLAYCVDHRFLTFHIRTLHKAISSLWGEVDGGHMDRAAAAANEYEEDYEHEL